MTTPTPLYPLLVVRSILGLLAVGVLLLAVAVAQVGPEWLDRAGGVAVAASYAALLAMRTGGRPLVFGIAALVFGATGALVAELGPASGVVHDAGVILTTGGAVGMAVLTAVLAVMLTTPAVRALRAAGEVLVAFAIAGVGSLAVIAFRPRLDVDRLDYAALALAFGLGFVLVFRLGAGWHGLGRRGLLVVLGGSAVLAVSVAYAELLRHYGTPQLVDAIDSSVRWTRDTIGAVPRPLQVLVGVPALLWGCHMRARRRQGWWVCVFGCAATGSVATTLANPGTTWLEAGLIPLYSLVLGLAFGYLAIRVDLALTGQRGSRARAVERERAVRPEPSRLQPLL
ncbi:hypothetical protein GCM10011584_14510 [Nocardioides phosphati]|uniref:Uncharacterized protein n=1 Tax=Nocardioides phosphati TaxID=1867775 RepID=A0ABQ2N9H4_9ACTN|nr:hypothetical protein [Nocardioides phosphati]GGO88171.1 hypothetical protein GCM10011584_14510 [Nocardioides phosphati]